MDIKTRAHCNITLRNARALEEILLTQSDVENIDESGAIDVIDRCQQIIKCMNMLLNLNDCEASSMQLDKMEGYIGRNSKKALEAKDAEIQQLKTALEVSESEKSDLIEGVQELNLMLVQLSNAIEELESK